MGIASGFGRWIQGNYQLGRQASNMLTRNMEPKKARGIGATLDVVAGSFLGIYMGLQTVGSIVTAGTALLGLATLSVPILPALGALAIGTIFGGLGVLCTALGFGFLSAAKEKIHIPGPKAAVVGVGHGIGWTAHQVARPFKWTAHKLRHPFKKAHDGNTGANKGPNGPDNGRPRPGHHSL